MIQLVPSAELSIRKDEGHPDIGTVTTVYRVDAVDRS